MSTTEYPLPSLTRPGRIRDGQRTRTAILKAAQTAFSTHGYASAGIREIAGIAGVNSALVRRYYGSKEMLFEAALGSMLDVGHLLVADRGTFGAFAVRFFVGHGEDTPNPVPMLTLAGGDPIARRVAMRLFDHQVLAPFERWLGPPDAAARAAAIHVLLIGFFSYWRLLPSWPSAREIDPKMLAWLAGSLQALADQGQPAAGQQTGEAVAGTRGSSAATHSASSVTP